ncbi:putative HTH-type transcriptional regulator YahB [BD1-7 clade bacterium]|uniref:Putative HTH-type transcriptional regulator YahB n=1 Tax=BD1-7 clade bacterium TaxID=2029982 RepID=A0A5S9Q840_9GAMM|nr:putative HTH-type transcriptional regulator YahB [BD1-7 clade bacterium]CAA0113937.1 putative HTH-type transcriptional regulator YahB [BD1-7 clade bacterium]
MHPNLLDQLIVFEHAVELGSFSAAAKRLNRTVAAVGYAIGQLEEHLGLTLFDRSGYRPELTQHGITLRRDVSIIMRRVERLESKVDNLRQQIATNVSIAITEMIPIEPLARATSTFTRLHPEFQLTIHEYSVDVAMQKLFQHEAALLIAQLWDAAPIKGLDGRQLYACDLMLIASHDHPLAALDDPFEYAELDNHQQVLMSPYPADTVDYNYGVSVTDLYTVNSVRLQKSLICHGAGWGFMAHHQIEDELSNGSLVQLKCRDLNDLPQMRVAAVWGTRKAPNPVLTKFIDLLEVECRKSVAALSQDTQADHSSDMT